MSASAEAARRQALRIGFAVASSMTLAMWLGSPLPFLAPVFAAQFLASSRRPLGVAPAVVIAAAILVFGQGLSMLSVAAAGYPGLFLLLLWTFYFACFAVQSRGKGGPLPFLLLAIGVLVPLTEMLHDDLDQTMIVMLAGGVLGGVVSSWVAHALFPDPGGAGPVTDPPPSDPGLRRPAASAAILAAAVALCLIDNRLSSAIVLPVTVATLLGQLDLARSGRAALGLVAGNVFGGVLACLAFAVVELRPELPVLFAVVLAVGLWLGAGAASDPVRGRLDAGALTIFLVLLGLGISPLPGSTAESFTARLSYVTAGALGALWAAALCWPRNEARGGLGASSGKG